MLRRYGEPPYSVAVLHGGPGAPGGMAPIARRLSVDRGVLEPLQTADSLDGQVEELREVLEQSADLPVTLVGSSWGAMLGFITASRYPSLVRKLIMVGSGVYEERYAPAINETRMSRLTPEERAIVQEAFAALGDPTSVDAQAAMRTAGELLGKVDTYDPLPSEGEPIEVQPEIFERVWGDAVQLRASGELLALGRRIRCPVVAIHGDYDPHPAAGIREPLASVVADFRFVLLEQCGHEPWIERQARDTFYELLERELGSA